MTKKIHLCRINNGYENAVKLLPINGVDFGYVTIGWGNFTREQKNREKLLEYVKNNNENDFRTEMYKWNEKKSYRYLWKFLQIVKGDSILIPLFDGTAVTCDVIEDPVDIDKIINSIENIAYNEDWSFVIKVNNIRIKKRIYASPNLQRKMKYYGTYLDISEFEKEYEEFKVLDKIKNLYDVIMEQNCNGILENIINNLNDKQFEKLVQWYFIKLGATEAYIPSKNEHGKEDYADSDIKVTFDNLKLKIRVQAKLHLGETSDWAIEQLKKYREIMDNGIDEYTYMYWVISTGKFSNETYNKAISENVRLIDGLSFAKMLLNEGINSLKEFCDEQNE